MINKKIFQNYLNMGYKVLRSPLLISNIDEKKLCVIEKVYHLNIAKKLIPSRSDEYLIIMGNYTDRKVISTNNKNIIDSANEQYKKQLEPLGSRIRFYYLILGGIEHHYAPNYIHVDKFIKGLDHIIDGRIKKGKYPGTFEVVFSANSTDHSSVQKDIEYKISLFDYISTIKRIGFQLLYYTITPIRKLIPQVEIAGEEVMIAPIDEKEFKMKKLFNKKVKIICKKLNQSYSQADPINKLIMLWSTIEKIFSNSYENLLYGKEIDSILNFCNSITTLREDKQRLDKFKSLINDKKIFHKESRNEIISTKISNLLDNANPDYIKKMIKKASTLRGKYLHELKNSEIEEINKINIFLENVLLRYIDNYS